MSGRPDLVIMGQVTIDDVVPALPSHWRRDIGGSSLYAIAGARHWIDPARIGLVARTGRGYPFPLADLLRAAGVGHAAITQVEAEHLIEWLIYEEDGSRRSLPRNASLRDVGAEGSPEIQPYYDLLLEISPVAADIPPDWLPAPAIHLCPQVGTRHRDSVKALRGKAEWISIDPSPRYSRNLDAAGLTETLRGATAFIPSTQEVKPLLDSLTPSETVEALRSAGFPEVALKRGADPIVVGWRERIAEVPTSAASMIDPTGAGDSFCGAYAACRLIGHDPFESARRAAASAALVVSCSGAAAALALDPPRL